MEKKKVLGRGLGALMGGGTGKASGKKKVEEVRGGLEEGTAGGRLLKHLPVGEISPGKGQPRRHFDDEALEELAGSIREKGIIEPLVVRMAKGGGYELIAGERRWRASKLADLGEVPVVIMDVTDEESVELALIENIQREDLNAIEEAEAFKTIADFGLSQEEVAKRVGKKRATVANYLRLLTLPAEIKEEIVKGNISMGHAKAILAVEGSSMQRDLARRIIQKGLSVREAEGLAAEISAEGEKRGKSKRQAPKRATELEDELGRVLGTKVNVKDRNGKGRIEISYFTADERERLIDILRQG